MLKNFLINRYKNFKKQQYFNANRSFSHGYAFIGAGTHSLSNLYPCIREMGIPLKYICTANLANAKKMASRFAGSIATDNITDIVKDKDIKAVFVSLPPLLHFETLKILLEASKNVFVEKPPCYSKQELNHLLNIQQQAICMTGLQKRFSKINGILKNKTDSSISYNYRYLSGAYPEGDPIVELFIHPIDNLIQLFGKATVQTISKINSKHGLTVFLILKHDNGVIGCTELSTGYSWTDPVDFLEINNKDEILKADYPNHLAGTRKFDTVLGMPIEKLLKEPVIQKIYLNVNGFSAASENNNLVIQGFYGELNHFVESNENNNRNDTHSLAGLIPVYEILEAIRRA